MVIHAAVLGSVIASLSASQYDLGRSGGTQLVYQVSLGESGLSVSNKLSDRNAGVVQVPVADSWRENNAELKIPSIARLLKVTSPEEMNIRKSQVKQAAHVPNIQKVNDSNRINSSLNSSGLGSYGSGGGTGGGDGRGRNGQGNGTSEFSRAILLDAPKPPFPSHARTAGFEGKVVLHAAIGIDGKVRDATIQQSSGRGDCDNAAKETIMEKWRFVPAQINGKEVESHEKIIIVYNLQKF